MKSLRHLTTALPLLASAVAATGCDDDWKRTQLADQGVACLVPAEQGTAPEPNMDPDPIAVGDEVFVYVVLDPCATLQCDRVESASCEATLDGHVIRVTSRATVATNTDVDGCPAACLPVEATCSVGVLPAGTYTVLHAGTTRTVTLPGTDACPQ